MNIYISTNLYRPNELEDIFCLIDRINDPNIGIELFPEWHDEKFASFVYQNIDKFKSYNISLHGPYYFTEHSKEKGSIEYERSKEYFIKTLELSQVLNSKYIVFHHNNCKIEPETRREMVNNATENLMELNELAKLYKADIVVENAGVISRSNMLFDEEEFIEMAKGIENNILIDIGHAFANNWDTRRVVGELKDKIAAYHIHNNDGSEDNHNRLRAGKLDIDDFFEIYKKYTPNADLVLEYSNDCRNDIEGIVEDVNEIKKILES